MDLCTHPLDAVDSLASFKMYRRGQRIYGAGDAASHWYRVAKGMARECAYFPDGRRQIVAFLLPDDVFGFGSYGQQPFTVETVVGGTVVACYPWRRLEPLIASDPGLAEQIREAAFEAIRRLQARMLCLGRTTALEKVGSFLLEMADRLPGSSMQEIALPMSRYDIADYLSLSVETVSRAVTELRRRGAISLDGAHHVLIVDAPALTRGLPRDARPVRARGAA